MDISALEEYVVDKIRCIQRNGRYPSFGAEVKVQVYLDVLFKINPEHVVFEEAYVKGY